MEEIFGAGGEGAWPRVTCKCTTLPGSQFIYHTSVLLLCTQVGGWYQVSIWVEEGGEGLEIRVRVCRGRGARGGRREKKRHHLSHLTASLSQSSCS